MNPHSHVQVSGQIIWIKKRKVSVLQRKDSSLSPQNYMLYLEVASNKAYPLSLDQFEGSVQELGTSVQLMNAPESTGMSVPLFPFNCNVQSFLHPIFGIDSDSHLRFHWIWPILYFPDSSKDILGTNLKQPSSFKCR